MNLRDKLARVNRFRVRIGPQGSDDSYGWNGAFLVVFSGVECSVICSDEGGWKHVSMAPRPLRVIPTWAMMCQLKDWFFDDEDWVVQYHPAKSASVNLRANCLYLWRPLETPLPLPEQIMV
jgi:hypothetical protein